MNRIFRRLRRQKHRDSGNKGQRRPEPRRRSALVAEPLESRMLLTTLTLPQDALEPVLRFVYADPEENDPGDEVTILNEIRIGTLSGESPEKDIVVEILDYRGADIPGTLFLDGVETNILGGPGGLSIIDEVPTDVLGGLGQAIDALATDNAGNTYGIINAGPLAGYLVTIDTSTGTFYDVTDPEYILVEVRDTENPTVTFSQFDALAFDPLTSVLYAVVTIPTVGEVLITIDVSDGEAEAVGLTAAGNASYLFSATNTNDIRTMVYNNERTADGKPIFLGFDKGLPGDDDEDPIPPEFVTISVTTVGTAEMVASTNRATAEEGDVIEGMMYVDIEGAMYLLGLYYTAEDDGTILLEPGTNAGVLVSIDLDADIAARYLEIVELGLQPTDEEDPPPIYLTGMSYDPLLEKGFATDPTSNTLYEIVTSNLVLVEDELIAGGIADVFMMYIASCTADTYITFTVYDPSQEENPYFPTGGEPSFLFVDEDDDEISTPEDAGGVMIGTIPQFIEEDLIWSAGLASEVGTFFDSTITAPGPGPGGKGAFPGTQPFRPGIIMPRYDDINPQNSDGTPLINDIGRIQVGGGVFGDVVIDGSIDTFYAGYLGTNNFSVSGDLNNLFVNTQAGGIEESDGSWTPVGSMAYGGDGVGPVLTVGGRLGSFYSNDDWGLPLVVQGRGDAPVFPGVLDGSSGFYERVHREIERKNTDDTDVLGSLFPRGGMDTQGGYIITNDSPLTAQFLGTVEGKINVIGSVEASSTFDTIDFYSFGVMAGQTLNIQLYSTFTRGITGHPYEPDTQTPVGLGVSLYDADLNLAAMLGTVDLVTGAPLPLVFTAEQAGIYTVAVEYVSGYRLEISGVSSTTLGGGNIQTDMRTSMTSSSLANVQVIDGNMGALSVGGYLRSANIKVDRGSLAGLRAGANGLPAGDLLSIAAGAGVPLLGFGVEVNDTPGNYDTATEVRAGGDIGQVSSPMKSVVNVFAGGDLQSLHIGGEILAPDPAGEGGGALGSPVNFAGQIVANGNIGVIHISGGYGPTMLTELETDAFLYIPGIFANDDGRGSAGIIDVILVGEGFGESSESGTVMEIPVSVGARGGNVRFVDIGGNIVFTIGSVTYGAFGPFSFDPGQSVVITDDSGVLVRISPGFVAAQVEDYLFGAQLPTQDEQAAADGVLTLKLLPVWDMTYENYLANGLYNHSVLGYAIIDINATDGVRVSTIGGPVEIGSITVAGVNDDTVLIKGKHSISVLRLTVAAIEPGGDTETNVGITRIINNTPGGDIVSLQIGSPDIVPPGAVVIVDQEEVNIPTVALISIKGNLGYTHSTTGQAVISKVLSPLNELEDDGSDIIDSTVIADPGGAQRSGLLSSISITKITVTGAMGEVDVRGNVGTIIINQDNSRAVGQFDGVAGAIIVYGNLGSIDLGDGTANVGTGRFARSGVFAYGTLGAAKIAGAGREIAGPIFAGQEIGRIQAKNGASITYSNALPLSRERLQPSDPNWTIAVTNQFDDYMIQYGAFSISGPIGTIEVAGQDAQIYGTAVSASSINTIKVNKNAEGVFYSRFFAGGQLIPETGQINQIIVGGQGIHSTEILAARKLNSLKVLSGGTIEDSEIRCDYQIGSIISDEINRTDIDAYNKLDKVTVRKSIFDLVIEAGALGGLQAKESILGAAVFVAGPVGIIQTRGDFISSIEVTGPFGNLMQLKAGGDIGTPTGGEIIVDGKVGIIQAGGDILTDLIINWDTYADTVKYIRDGYELGSLKAGGKIVVPNNSSDGSHIGGDVNFIQSGGEFGIFGSKFTVHGNLNKFNVGSGKNPSDMESSLTVDADLGLMMVYGDMNGQINVVGDFGSLNLRGSEDNTAMLNASVTVGGVFNQLSILGGDIALTDVVDGGTVVVDPWPQKVTIQGSDIYGLLRNSHEAGADLTIDGSIKSTGRLVSTLDVGTLWLKGDIEAGGVLDITGNLEKLIVEGDIYGIVHVTGSIGEIQTTNIEGTAAIVTAGGDIGKITVAEAITDSYVLAGFEMGTILDADGNLLETRDERDEQILNGQAKTGSIDQVKVELLNNSVIAAGVSPGANVIFGDGDETPGPGLSSIGIVTIGETAGTGTEFGVFADTQIRKLRVGGVVLATPVFSLPVDNGFRAWVVDEAPAGGIVGDDFQKGTPFKGTINGVTVTIVMSGPGTGTVAAGAEQIETIRLEGTTEKTRVMIKAAGADTIDVGEFFTAHEDDSLGKLIIDGRLANATNDASLEVGGGVKILKLAGVGSGSAITINGAVSKADLGAIGGSADINILGEIGRLNTGAIGEDAEVSAAGITRAMVNGALEGVLNVLEGSLGSIIVAGDAEGVISSAGDIGKILIKGMLGAEGNREVQGVRAGQNIGKFTAWSLSKAVVAAGANLNWLNVLGDVSFSTIAAGLEIGAAGILFDGDEVAGMGDLVKVLIGGDLVQSNLVAGLAPGTDEMFGTEDDQIQAQSIEEIDAPKVVGVYFEGDDLTTINVQFKRERLDPTGNIRNLTIKGNVEGSANPNELFAIAAAGRVQTVLARGAVFEGADNVERLEINSKALLGSTIEMADITSLNAATAPFQVWADGLDHEFGTADDILISGDDNTNNVPTVFVTFDQESNVASFHKTDEFALNRYGTNYYQIRLDAAQVTNRMGVPLDGEYIGVWPSGDSFPGDDNPLADDDFVYYFAVADLGDWAATAFSPFADQTWPDNTIWHTTGKTGDNQEFITSDALDDADFVRLNDLQQGQIFNATVTDTNNSLSSIFDVALWQVVQDNPYNFVTAGNIAGLSELTVSQMTLLEDDEVQYSMVGYDDTQETFILISTTTLDSTELLVDDPNDPGNDIQLTREVLSDYLDNMSAADITIEQIKALEFGAFEELEEDEDDEQVPETMYAIVTVNEDDVTRDALLVINNILEPSQGMVLSDIALNFDITTLAFGNISDNHIINGRLYGIDATTQTLLLIDPRTIIIDIVSGPRVNENFGAATIIGSKLGNLGDPGDSTFDVDGIDFDGLGILWGLERNSNLLVVINPNPVAGDDAELMESVAALPAGDYRDLAFDPAEDWDFEKGFLVDAATGDLIHITGDLIHIEENPAAFDLVTSNQGLTQVQITQQIPADGDYILVIMGRNEPADYELDVLVFDDGDSDFGTDTTQGDIFYNQLFPNNRPVNLEPLPGNTDLVRDEDDQNLYRFNPARPDGGDDDPRLDWPVEIHGTLLEPGDAGQVVIDAKLGCATDVDVYTFHLEEGQRIIVDIDAETLFGRNGDTEILVGIYNGDFEALATIMDESDDVLAPTAAQRADTIYDAYALFEMANHSGVVIDPDDEGWGTYYVVVSTLLDEGAESIPYQLTITTSAPVEAGQLEQIKNPPSQLVWLAFDGAVAEYLLNDQGGLGGSPDVINRPAFDAGDFGFADRRPELIEAIADQIEQYYRDAGLSEDEIEFTTIEPGTAGSSYAAGSVYSTVIIGGKSPWSGLLGIAEKLDRHNEDRTDMVTVFSKALAEYLVPIMDDDTDIRFQQSANAVANTAAHELAHILGLEHATEIYDFPANNMMDYSSAQVRIGLKEFAERNSYRLHSGDNPEQIGFENEIDMLLRYIGSGTVMGE